MHPTLVFNKFFLVIQSFFVGFDPIDLHATNPSSPAQTVAFGSKKGREFVASSCIVRALLAAEEALCAIDP